MCPTVGITPLAQLSSPEPYFPGKYRIFLDYKLRYSSKYFQELYGCFWAFGVCPRLGETFQLRKKKETISERAKARDLETMKVDRFGEKNWSEPASSSLRVVFQQIVFIFGVCQTCFFFFCRRRWIRTCTCSLHRSSRGWRRHRSSTCRFRSTCRSTWYSLRKQIKTNQQKEIFVSSR